MIRLARPRRVIGAEKLVDDFQYALGPVIRQTIINGLAIAPRDHQTLKPQPRQLLTDSGLPGREQVFQLGQRFVTRYKMAQDQQAPFMTDRLEKVAGRRRILDELIHLGI